MTTLCYIEKDNKYLMLHRIKKEHDINKDKWIGVGGHFEHGESPEDCMFREVMEETGLTPLSYRFCGIVTFLSDMGTEKEAWEYMCLYHIEEFKGEIKECDEGVLEWVDKEKILYLDLWEGDRLFLRYMQERRSFFSLKLVYEEGDLTAAVLDGKPLEFFDILDEKGNKTGRIKERSLVHEDGDIHGTVHIWIRRKTEKGYDLLLQKRSKQKDSFPGCYDISSAGHISAGDEPLETALRELEEELGIKAEPEQLKKVCMHEGSMNGNFYGREFKNHEISTVYMYEETVDITKLKLQKEEVEEVMWMDQEELIQKAYEIAVERYAAVGVDTEQVLKTMQDFHLSLHCWQADDVAGFEVQAGSLTGGIQATGNYPGKARNIDELRADILKAASYIPGTHRLNLHEIYGDFQGKVVDRDQVEPEHFKSWIEWGKEHNMKLDFNSTSFSHPKSGDLSLSNPDEGIRQFWIEHTKRCRAVAEEMGKAQGDPCIMNLWVHDGSKDITVNRMKYRALLKDSLDQIFATEYKNMKDCIESKVFGIGLESYTVGSNDFYIGYGASRNKMITLDTGHFHPTESVADKVSSLLLYVPELMLHVSRPVRWDSDHVTIMDDPTMELFSEIVRCGALDRVHYGLDYFDASINRIGAYVIGSRAAQKCMTRALLEPIAKLREYEANGQGFQRLALLEEEKALPWNAVWDMFCLKNNVPVGEDFIAEIEKYEAEVTSKR